MTPTTTVIVGGGIIGLSCARAIALRASLGSSIFLLEVNKQLGAETTGRNSSVIHSGIYYPTNSAKANLCVRGRHQMYDYLKQHDVPFSRCGKLIVSNSPQETLKLMNLLQQAQLNGLSQTDCRMLTGSEAFAMEPELRCEQALLCMSTGIVDVQHLLQSLQADLEITGVDIVYDCEAQSVERGVGRVGRRFVVNTSQGPLDADIVVNCAGLRAFQLAHRMNVGMRVGVLPSAVYYAKGSYFKLQPNKKVFNHLVYPVPTDGGLGVHSTIDMGGNLRFGPDVEWLARPRSHHLDHKQGKKNEEEGSNYDFAWSVDDCAVFPHTHDEKGGSRGFAKYYTVDAARCQSFYSDIRKYYPGLPDDSLVPDYAGIRPKLTGPGQVPGDFLLQGREEHGVLGLVNMFGMESPGLTSSLAIAEQVANEVFSS